MGVERAPVRNADNWGEREALSRYDLAIRLGRRS